ncbi:APC family permease [Rhodococcus sp. NPDC057014]|uniref:APC family permease n=1 Tax=Rhodococcus sp. NPDC057014 TaxID=3346000 RepID=UPI003634F434
MTNSPEFSPPAVAAPPAPDEGSHALLHRGLGVGSIVFMVVAAAAPLGVMVANTPIITGISGSAGAPLFFLIATVVLVFFSVGFTAMSKFVPNAGAFYSYIQAGLGRHVGSGAAALALVSYGVLLIGVNGYLGVATSNVVSAHFHVDIQWWIYSFAWLLIIGVLGYRDIELSSKVLGVLLVVEIAVVVVLDIAIVVKGGESGLGVEPLSFSTFTSGTPTLGLMFAFFCFFGFEATAVFRNEAKDPDRTVPRATYIAVLSIGIFYAISSWAVMEGAGSDSVVEKAKADPENLVLDLAASYGAPILKDVMQVLLVTSTFACILSFHNVITRYQFTLAGKGMLPKRLADVSEKHLAPSTSSLIASAISLAAMALVTALGWDPITSIYTWLSGAATLGLIGLMVLTNLAVIFYFRTKASAPTVWHSLLAPAMSLISLTIILALVIANFSLLVGDKTTAAVVGGLIAVAFAVGLAGAEVMKRQRPDRYAELAADTVRRP